MSHEATPIPDTETPSAGPDGSNQYTVQSACIINRQNHHRGPVMSLQLMSAKQCAAALSISIPTWWALVKDGKAPKKHQISTNRVAWRSDDIEDLINRIAPREVPQ